MAAEFAWKLVLTGTSEWASDGDRITEVIATTMEDLKQEGIETDGLSFAINPLASGEGLRGMLASLMEESGLEAPLPGESRQGDHPNGRDGGRD